MSAVAPSREMLHSSVRGLVGPADRSEGLMLLLAAHSSSPPSRNGNFAIVPAGKPFPLHFPASLWVLPETVAAQQWPYTPYQHLQCSRGWKVQGVWLQTLCGMPGRQSQSSSCFSCNLSVAIQRLPWSCITGCSPGADDGGFDGGRSSQPPRVLQEGAAGGWALGRDIQQDVNLTPDPAQCCHTQRWHQLLLALWSSILHLGIAQGKYSWELCKWVCALGDDIVAHTWIAKRFLCPIGKSQKSTRKKIKGRITQKRSSFELFNEIHYMPI